MNNFLRFLQVFALGAWVGSILYFSAVVTQGAFRVLPTIDDAGRLVGFTLNGLHWMGVVAAVIYLLAAVALERSAKALAHPAAIGVILMLICTLISQQMVIPRMDVLRLQMGSVAATSAANPLRAATPASRRSKSPTRWCVRARSTCWSSKPGAALTPRAEIEGEMGESQPGLQARLMSQALRKLTASISRSNTMVIFINQIRMKIGVMYGSPETTSGGNALKFYASVRLDIRRIGAIKEREQVVGNQTRVKVVKNKVAPPFKQVEFDIMYGEGVSKAGELIDLGVKAGVVEKSGAWFSFDSVRLGQGRENSKAFLKTSPEMADRIERAIRENAGLIAERILEQGGPAEDEGEDGDA